MLLMTSVGPMFRREQISFFVKPLSSDGCASPEIAVSLFEHLAADKILVRYFSKHPQTNCFVRISIGKPVEMTMLMKSIKAWTQKA